MNARRWTAGLLAAVATVALVGCTSSKGQEKTCTTTTDGIFECAPDQRSAAPKLAGELLAGGTYDVSRGPRSGGGGQLLGLLVRALPGRGGRPGSRLPGHQGFRGHLPRHQRAGLRGTRPRRSSRAGSPIRASSTRRAGVALDLDIPPNTRPGDGGARPAGPDRGGDPGRRQAGGPAADRRADRRREAGAELMGETFAQLRSSGPAAARHRRGGARRPGQLPLPVRAAAGPRLPVVRHRPGRRRPGRAARQPADPGSAPGGGVGRSGSGAARVGAVKGRVLAGTLLFIAGFTVVFVATAILFASIGQVALRLRAALEIVVGVLIIVLGLGYPRHDPRACNGSSGSRGCPPPGCSAHRSSGRSSRSAGCPAPARRSAR